MNQRTKEHIYEGLAIACLLLLVLWFFSNHATANQASSDDNDPEGQSAQPNSLSIPALSITPQQDAFPIQVSLPQDNFTIVGAQPGCGCTDGSNCPVSPYTIANVNKMLQLGTVYANAMIEAGNATAQAIADTANNAFIFPVETGTQTSFG